MHGMLVVVVVGGGAVALRGAGRTNPTHSLNSRGHWVATWCVHSLYFQFQQYTRRIQHGVRVSFTTCIMEHLGRGHSSEYELLDIGADDDDGVKDSAVDDEYVECLSGVPLTTDEIVRVAVVSKKEDDTSVVMVGDDNDDIATSALSPSHDAGHPAYAPEMHVCAVPGMNGALSERRYWDNHVFTGMKLAFTCARTMETDPYKSDLGQRQCVDTFVTRMSLLPTTPPIVVHAGSQGSATVMNAFATGRLAQMESRVRLVILESVLASGNSGIWHTMNHMPRFKRYRRCMPLLSLLGGYFWAPWFFKLFMMHRYDPWGDQPVYSLCKFPHDLPVLIIHARGDETTSYDDACALYAGLRANGHQHVFFLTLENNGHTHLFNSYNSSYASGFHLVEFVRQAIRRDYARMHAMVPSPMTYVHSGGGYWSTQSTISPIGDGVHTPEQAYTQLLRWERGVRLFLPVSIAVIVLLLSVVTLACYVLW